MTFLLTKRFNANSLYTVKTVVMKRKSGISADYLAEEVAGSESCC